MADIVSSPIIGYAMQSTIGVSLGATPLTPTTVTVTSGTPGAVFLSKTTTGVGAASLTFTNVASTSVPTVYVQGEATGTSTVTVTATGHSNGTGTVTVYPSGFIIRPSQGNISTTTLSAASTVSLVPAILSPTTMAFYNSGELPIDHRNGHSSIHQREQSHYWLRDAVHARSEPGNFSANTHYSDGNEQ